MARYTCAMVCTTATDTHPGQQAKLVLHTRFCKHGTEAHTHTHIRQKLQQTCLGSGHAHCPFLTPHMFLALLHHDRLLTHGAFEHIPIAMQLVVLHVSQGHRGIAVDTHTRTQASVIACSPARYIPHIRVAHTSSCTCPPLSGHRCRQSKPWTGDSHPPHASWPAASRHRPLAAWRSPHGWGMACPRQ